jgi:nicotinate-nucleotide pyrophosphorylase (carboxylating)
MSLDPEIVESIRRALAEDIGSGDVTTELTIDASRRAVGRFYARQPMVSAGTEVLPVIFEKAERLEIFLPSRAQCEYGDCIAEVEGEARLLLTHERVSLNFLQRLSGVATLARQYVAAVHGTKCKILDTRKTTPGLRRLEKMAAHAGGATNHRMDLYDAVLIKNNHITASGGVAAALARVNQAAVAVPIEIEVRTREELDQALDCGAKRLLLDNLTPLEAKEWIDYIAGRAEVELSGGVTLETVAAYAKAGPDYISAGAITHSAPAVDINFRIELV